MSPDQQQIINAIAFHVGQLVLNQNNRPAFRRVLQSLKHEVSKAEQKFNPVIHDPAEDVDDDEL